MIKFPTLSFHFFHIDRHKTIDESIWQRTNRSLILSNDNNHNQLVKMVLPIIVKGEIQNHTNKKYI